VAEKASGEVYPIVFIDAIHFSVKNDGIVGKKAVYIVLAIDIEGQKDVIGIYVGEMRAQILAECLK